MTNRLVIIPTYNEKENITHVLDRIHALPESFDILIIDDHSPDGTAEIIKRIQKERPNLYLIEREGKLGLGTAYIKGFQFALEKGYEFIFEMDADLSHNPDDLLRLYQALVKENADLAIGSRYISGVNVINWPLGRVIMSYLASIYVRLITGLKIKDTTAGFKCYRNTVLETIHLDRIKSKGYVFQIEMKFHAWKYGFKIIEVPIVFTNREKGVSKMSGGIFNEAVWGVIKLKFKSFFRSYKV
jgi:dolichol-phosphate mannosyltransferase